MRKILIDSGPLIALFDRGDKYHNLVLDFLRPYKGELITSWAVVTEVSHMLDFNLKIQIDFLRWIEKGGLKVYNISINDISEIIEMMEKYLNVPMDLADASLIYIANKEEIKDIISLDSDFDIYKTIKNRFLRNILTQSNE